MGSRASGFGPPKLSKLWGKAGVAPSESRESGAVD